MNKQAVEQGSTDTSAVAEHVWNKVHKVDWKAVEGLDMNTMEWYKECVIESWHFKPEQSAVNKDQGIMPLSR